MKKTFLLIPLALLLLVGCRKTNNPTVYSLGVNMHETFEEDNVRVYIDNQPLLNGKVSTNHTLGFGGRVSTANTEGHHTIKVVVNDSTIASEDFAQHSDLYIGVSYNKSTRTIAFVYSAHPFMYD